MADTFRTQGVTMDTVYDHLKGREPVLYGRGTRFEGLSTTADAYRQWEIPAPPAPRARAPGENVPFDGTSSYKMDYPAHDIRPARPAQAAAREYRNVPFDGTSTYSDVFRAYAIDPNPPQRREAQQAPYVPFEGTSAYKDTYRAHDLPERRVVEPPPMRPSQPFEGRSSYQDQYPQHAMPPPAPPRAGPPPREDVPFDGTTTNRMTYVPHQIESNRPAPSQAPPRAPTKFDGTTTTADAYKQWDLPERVERKAPPIQPTLPFEGTTTTREAFKGWKLPARRQPLGVAMLGDQFFTLIPSDVQLPYRTTQVFTTAHDNQDTVCILVLEGAATRASSNRVLGQFDLTGVPPGPRGEAKIEVAFALDANRVLTVEAEDRDTGRHADWHAGGGQMIARVDSSRMDTEGYVHPATPEH
eukprot:jgi/Tetstr1/420426/TSEL_011541.t1